jgi:hypothetical protein
MTRVIAGMLPRSKASPLTHGVGVRRPRGFVLSEMLTPTHPARSDVWNDACAQRLEFLQGDWLIPAIEMCLAGGIFDNEMRHAGHRPLPADGTREKPHPVHRKIPYA